jgi:hypothetical protein
MLGQIGNVLTRVAANPAAAMRLARMTVSPAIIGGAKFLGNPLNRAAVGGGMGFLTNDEGLGGRFRGAAMGAGLGALSGPALVKPIAGAVGSIPGVTPALATAIGAGALPAAGVAIGGMQAQGNPGNQMGGYGQYGLGYGVGAGMMGQSMQPNMTGAYIGGGGGPVPTLGGRHDQMMVGPDGNIYSRIDPTGPWAGARYGSHLDTMRNISNENLRFEAAFPRREMVRKADMEREIKAQQLKRNMDLAYEIANRGHATTSNIAEESGRQMGTLLNSSTKLF